MDEEGLMESERLQIEHLRELEMEELEIEEVDFDHHSSSEDDEQIVERRDDGGAGQSGGFTFDTNLASLHTYLGEVDDTHHRVSFLDGGAILNIPIFYLEGVVLFPEATLPLRVIQPRFKAAVEKALNQVEAPYTIGVVHVYRHPEDFRLCFATVGTTAEIRQYKRLDDGSLNVVTRGQQRFRMRRRWVDVEGAPCAEIQVIEEDLPLRTPKDAFAQMASVSNSWKRSLSHPVFSNGRLGCKDVENDSESMSEQSFENDLSPMELRLHRSIVYSSTVHDRIDEETNSDNEIMGESSYERSYPDNFRDISQHTVYENQNEGEGEGASLVTGTFASGRNSCIGEGWKESAAIAPRQRAPRSFWPHWVYRMYDSYCLAHRAADMWKQIVGAPSMDDLVKKPGLLSFHIASKIPVSESTRQELLEIDGISYRLRREIELLESFDRIHCKTCQIVIARRSDMLVMSSDGPLGAYVNPTGHVHEIMTLDKVNSVALIGRPVEEYSWFPGYAWTIANCAICETQLGWLFTATNKKMKPKSFWGIRSSQVADPVR